MEEAKNSPGWLTSLKNGVDASSGEADEYGVSSFVFRARKPFHPLRLHSFLKKSFCFAEEWNASIEIRERSNEFEDSTVKQQLGSILRSKGTCWIAGRDNDEMGWAQSGRIIQLNSIAPWYCITPPEEWEGGDTEEERSVIEARMNHEDDKGNTVPFEFGDRRQEVVFIGTELHQTAIEEELYQCLLTDQEMKNHSMDLPTGAYPDPLHPALVQCDSARSLFLIARPGQNQHVQISPGFALTIHNIALNMTDYEQAERVIFVKVWLDKSDTTRCGTLLATLRPLSCEQHSLKLQLLPCDEQDDEALNNRRIRLEVVEVKSCGLSATRIMELVEVHIVGKIDPLPYSPTDDDGASNDGYN